jgi:arsenate reductase
MAEPPIVLFLCVANSARSQMAEGLARRAAPPDVRVMSAGSRPTSVSPYAIRVMAEVGIDIADHRSKSIDDVPLDAVQTVVTLCAEEECPVLPGHAQVLRWPHDDPAAALGDVPEILESFRRVRDQIAEKVEGLFEGTG